MAGRIKIEPYKPLDVHTPPVPGGGYIQVDASAGKFAPSPLARMGLDMAQGLPSAVQAVSAQLARDDEAAVKDADARLGEAEQALLFDPRNGYLNTQGQEAVERAATVLNTYSQAQTREAEDLPNEAQRQMLEELAQRRLATFSEQVERHSTAERQRWYDTTSDRRIALMQADAGLHWSDDALLHRALGTVRAEVRGKAERHGWDSPLTEAALRQQTSRTLVSAIGAAVERDPERARSLRTRYDQHIAATDRAALDALLTEAQTRQRAQQASAEILNSTPPNGQTPTLQWQLQQAEAIAEPGVRAATLRTLHATAAAAEARARALAEQVLARVLKDGLTDPSQIPVREWVALDSERRQAIEARLDHNATGTEPAPNSALVDELATQITQVPGAFARRDLVPSVAQLPLPQWQRFRNLQASIRRNDPVTEDEIHAIKRGLQLETKMLTPDVPADIATNYRAELIEEIDTWRRINGKSPDDDDIAAMVERQIPDGLAWNVGFPFDLGIRSDLRPGVHQIQDSTTYGSNPQAMARAAEALIRIDALRRVDEALRSLPRRNGLDPEVVAWALGMIQVTAHPRRINANGEAVYYDPRSNRYVVRNTRGGTGYWAEFDAQGRVIGTTNEGLIPVERSAQLPADELEKIWQNPPLVPPEMPPSVLPGRPIEPRPPTILKGPNIDAPPPPAILEGPDINAPRPPTILKGPDIDAPPLPTIYESREKPRHHNIPQFLWNPHRRSGQPPKFEFGEEARKFFEKAITEIPQDEHWDYLHEAYNVVAERAMRAYLKKTKADGETEEQFARRMSYTQAEECYKYLVNYILNPPETDDEEEIRQNKRAKAFLLNVFRYATKPK